MQEKQTQKQCQNSGFSAADFLARLSALQEPEKDSEIRAALSSLNWPAWLKPGSLRIHNIKKYLLAALYNAPLTIENYYAAQINHDLYGRNRGDVNWK